MSVPEKKKAANNEMGFKLPHAEFETYFGWDRWHRCGRWDRWGRCGQRCWDPIKIAKTHLKFRCCL